MVLKLFATDYCPYGQRTWIALLEKEADPSKPVNFEWNETNYWNLDLPNTKEFLSINNTGPCGIATDGSHLKESLPMAFWADQTFPNNPLTPPGQEGMDAVKAAIAKFTSGEFDMTAAMFKVVQATTEEARNAAAKKLFASYTEFARDCVKSGGPFLFGSKFSIADIAVYPFVERAFAWMPHYAKMEIPNSDELTAFHAWYKACRARPSVAITSADRTQTSMETNPFEKVKRDEYLIETGAFTVYGIKDQLRKQLRHAPPGKKTADIAAAIEEKKKQEAEKAAAEAAAAPAK